MQAPFSPQARFGAAPSTQLPRRVLSLAPGCSNIFTTLSLASAFASTTVSAPHAANSAFPQPTPKLLPPQVGPGAPIPLDRFTRDSMSTGQNSDAFASGSQPASATGRSPWTEGPDVFLDEGPSANGGSSASGPSASMPSDAELQQPSANDEPITEETAAKFELSDVPIEFSDMNLTTSRSRPWRSQTAYRSRERQTSPNQSPRSAVSTTSATAPGLQAAWSHTLGPATPSTSGTAAPEPAGLREASAASSSRALHASVTVSLRSSLPEKMFASFLAMSYLGIYSDAADLSAARTLYCSVPPHPKAVRYKFVPATLGVTVPRQKSLDLSPLTSAPLMAAPQRQTTPIRATPPVQPAKNKQLCEHTTRNSGTPRPRKPVSLEPRAPWTPSILAAAPSTP